MHVKVVVRYIHRFWRRQQQVGDPGTLTWPGVPDLTETSYHLNPLPSFSPPSSCLGTTYTLSPRGSDFYDQASSLVSRGAQRACFPEEAFDIASGAIYSPGTCPEGYLTVTGGITSANRELTYAYCCPPPLTLSTYTADNSTYAICNEDGLGAESVILLNGSSTTTTLVVTLQADPLTVLWESTDLSYLARAAATTNSSSATASANSTSARATPNPGSRTSTIPTPTSEPSLTPAPRGLSVGAQAGIGVGVAAAAVVAISLLLFWWRRHNRNQSKRGDNEIDTHGKAELSGEGVHRELPEDGALYEAHETSKPPEMEAVHRAELETDWTGWEAPAVVNIDLSQPSRDASSSNERHQEDSD